MKQVELVRPEVVVFVGSVSQLTQKTVVILIETSNRLVKFTIHYKSVFANTEDASRMSLYGQCYDKWMVTEQGRINENVKK